MERHAVLVRLWSDMFHQGDHPREPINFEGGLNVVEGADDASNSIGKSTVLAMINFAFGGQSWPRSQVTRIYGRHTVGFTFRFDHENFHFLRIADPEHDAAKYVYPCDENYTSPQPPMRAQAFRLYLQDKYGLTNADLSLRSMVGPYVRLAGRDNLDPRRVLQQSASDSPRDAIERLEQLAGMYGEVKEEYTHFNERRRKLRVFDRADHEGVFIIPPAKNAEAEAKKRRIAQLRTQSERLVLEEDDRLLTDDDMVTSRNAKLRAQIRVLRDQQESIREQIAFLSTSQDPDHAPRPADWQELAEIFPRLNKDRMSKVAQFHQRIRANLASQAQQETLRLESVDQAIGTQIRQLSRQLVKAGSAARLPRVTLDNYSALQSEIRDTELALKQHELRNELADLSEQARDTLEQVQADLLPRLENRINDHLEALAHTLGEGIAPRLELTRFDRYTYSVPGDNGTGSAYMGMVMYDYAILDLSDLPFVIHDTPVWANISKPRQARLLSYLDGLSKQVFLAFDSTPTLEERAQEIVKTHTVISLGPGDDSLFGRIGSMPTAQRPIFGLPADQLPAYEGKQEASHHNEQLTFDLGQLS